jgi:Protein of unknown function, DUF488
MGPPNRSCVRATGRLTYRQTKAPGQPSTRLIFIELKKESAHTNNMIHLYTIGFTKKSAEAFFTKLSTSGVGRIIDVRLNNVSQLAGFTKKDDLPYFLRVICGIEYFHIRFLLPPKTCWMRTRNTTAIGLYTSRSFWTSCRAEELKMYYQRMF